MNSTQAEYLRRIIEAREIVELGREGSIVYYADGTGYDYPDGSGRAIQVWQKRPCQEPIKYCLLSEWERSSASRRIGDPKREVRPQGETWRGIIPATLL